MKHSSVTLYEIVSSETNEKSITYSREKALDHYYDGDMVFERRFSITEPSVFTQTQVNVVMRWNNNPEFNPNTWEEA
jgi:hypothetical protein